MNQAEAISLTNFITEQLNRFTQYEFKPRFSLFWQKWVKDPYGYDWHLFFVGPGIFAAVRTIREITIKTDISELEKQDIDEGIVFRYSFKKERYIPVLNSFELGKRSLINSISQLKKNYAEFRKQYL